MFLPRWRDVGNAVNGPLTIFWLLIWPLVLYCALLSISFGLWFSLGWPTWILWIGLISMWFRLDIVFWAMICVAFVAGIFNDAWHWSLALPGLIAVAFVSNACFAWALSTISRTTNQDLRREPNGTPLPLATDALPSSASVTATMNQTPSAVIRVRPWIRFSARLFDIWVFGFFFAFFVAGLIAILAPETSLASVIFDKDNELWFGMASLLAWVLVEATLLSTFGTTPGKWLFKIKLIPPSGSVPTFRAALSRSIAVWWRGLGAGFPLISLLTLLRAQSRLSEQGITSWDRDDGFVVVHDRIGTVRGLAAVGFFAAGFFLMAVSDAAEGTASAIAGNGELSQKQEALAAITWAQMEVERSDFETAYSDEFQTGIGSSPMPEAKARGEFGELERFLIDLSSRLESQQHNYLLELEAIGWDSILDPSRIEQDTTLAESRVIVRQARAIVGKYEVKTVELIDDARQQIPALAIREALKREALAGFDKGIDNSRVRELWNLEMQVINYVDDIITLLTTSQHGEDWVVVGNEILFVNDNDLATFNVQMEGIHRAIEHQEQIRKSGIADGKQQLDEAKRTLAEWGT